MTYTPSMISTIELEYIILSITGCAIHVSSFDDEDNVLHVYGSMNAEKYPK